MNNLRFTVFFLLGIVLLSAALVVQSERDRLVATEVTRNTLCTYAPDAVDALEVFRRGDTNGVALVRDARGEWLLKTPYAAPADAAAVARLVDLATVVAVGDMRTANELAELREDFADFGLSSGGVLQLRLHSGAAVTRVTFGAETASGKEVYARTEGLRNVFTVPAEAVRAVPSDADGFRRRTLLSCAREEISGIDLRVTDAPFVKLVRGRAGWSMAAPVVGPADLAAVSALADGLVGARIAGFVLPSAAQPDAVADGEAIKPSALAPYGLGVDAGQAVTVRTASGSAEQVVFGARAGTNLVYALVRNGTAVVTVDVALADLCRAGGASFHDTRVFPLGEGERLESISFAAGTLVYVLALGTNDLWRLEAPVAAPADPAAAAAMADRVLRLRRKDVPDAVPEADAVRVAVTTTAGALPAVTVPKRVFADCGALADLRSKTVQEFDPAAVRRITVQPKDGEVVAVRRDAGRMDWVLDSSAGGDLARVSVEHVKKLFAALTRTEAVGVETVAATPADYLRCGLREPLVTIAVDFDGAVARKNLLVGGAAPGGGRYASAGGADAIFILSRATVADLTLSITEQVRK